MSKTKIERKGEKRMLNLMMSMNAPQAAELCQLRAKLHNWHGVSQRASRTTAKLARLAKRPTQRGDEARLLQQRISTLQAQLDALAA